jgi:hypothetical protein
MVTISEVFPNPAGADAGHEWIELYNAGSETVSLRGWSLKDAAGKTYVFKDARIAPGEYLVIASDTSKIALNNNAEKVFLYDASGELADLLEYGFSVGSDVSVMRIGDRIGSGSSTKGIENVPPQLPDGETYVTGGVIGDEIGGISVVVTALVVGMALSAGFMYLLRQIEKVP